MVSLFIFHVWRFHVYLGCTYLGFFFFYCIFKTVPFLLKIFSKLHIIHFTEHKRKQKEKKEAFCGFKSCTGLCAMGQKQLSNNDSPWPHLVPLHTPHWQPPAGSLAPRKARAPVVRSRTWATFRMYFGKNFLPNLVSFRDIETIVMDNKRG